MVSGWVESGLVVVGDLLGMSSSVVEGVSGFIGVRVCRRVLLLRLVLCRVVILVGFRLMGVGLLFMLVL